jgi:hypothetical protein
LIIGEAFESQNPGISVVYVESGLELLAYLGRCPKEEVPPPQAIQQQMFSRFSKKMQDLCRIAL